MARLPSVALISFDIAAHKDIQYLPRIPHHIRSSACDRANRAVIEALNSIRQQTESRF
jgi:hypothetical protein